MLFGIAAADVDHYEISVQSAQGYPRSSLAKKYGIFTRPPFEANAKLILMEFETAVDVFKRTEPIEYTIDDPVRLNVRGLGLEMKYGSKIRIGASTELFQYSTLTALDYARVGVFGEIWIGPRYYFGPVFSYTAFGDKVLRQSSDYVESWENIDGPGFGIVAGFRMDENRITNAIDWVIFPLSVLIFLGGQLTGP